MTLLRVFALVLGGLTFVALVSLTGSAALIAFVPAAALMMALGCAAALDWRRK